jgi:hypothetical protein
MSKNRVTSVYLTEFQARLMYELLEESRRDGILLNSSGRLELRELLDCLSNAIDELDKDINN